MNSRKKTIHHLLGIGLFSSLALLVLFLLVSRPDRGSINLEDSLPVAQRVDTTEKQLDRYFPVAHQLPEEGSVNEDQAEQQVELHNPEFAGITESEVVALLVSDESQRRMHGISAAVRILREGRFEVSLLETLERQLSNIAEDPSLINDERLRAVQALELLPTLNERTLDILFGVISEDEFNYLRRRVGIVLGVRAAEDPRVRKGLMALLEDGDAELRELVLHALSYAGTPDQATSNAVYRQLESEDSAVQQRALQAVSDPRFSDDASADNVGRLFEIIDDATRDETIRVDAVRALGRTVSTGDHGLGPESLSAIFLDEDYPKALRIEAILSFPFATNYDEQHMTDVQSLSNHSDKEIAASAQQALRWFQESSDRRLDAIEYVRERRAEDQEELANTTASPP